jgi:hypothetical protein
VNPLGVTTLIPQGEITAAFQFEKGAQQFVRIHNVAATLAMGINDPTPTISGNGAAITP